MIVQRGYVDVTYQMRILQLLQHLDIIQLYIQELIDGFEGAFDGDVVFEFDGYFVVDEGFEETVYERLALV